MMSNGSYLDVDALERLMSANLDLRSPEKSSQVASTEIPTVRKIIKVKLKTFSTNSPSQKSPTNSSSQKSPTNSPSQKSPTNSVDVSDETPIFNFSLVSAELEKTIETDSFQQKEAGVSVDTLTDVSIDESISVPVSTDEPISVPVSTDEPTPVISFATPDYSSWLVAIEHEVLIDWITFPFKDYFVKVADIELDDEILKKSTKMKKEGEKARQTFIRFNTTITKKSWSEEGEWIYIFLVDGKIVKIGGTRTGLLKRCGSYLSGHGIPELKGSSTSTNAYIYWTFLHLLLQRKKVEMYAYRLPEAVVTQTAFGRTRVIRTQCFHDWEAYCMEEFAKLYGSFPPLSDNCDPRHREKGKGKKKTSKK